MKKSNLLTSIILVLASFHEPAEAASKTSAEQRKNVVQDTRQRLTVRVAPGDWGNANPAEIEVLLNSVGRELLKQFPGRRTVPIVVGPTRGGPVVMYQKGPSNEYRILLSAKDDHWAEYVYEFSHELMHILAGYELRPQTSTARHVWFEEMICEAASLYMLKRYAMSWHTLAPRPEWRGYAPELQRFTNRALTEKHRRLPTNVSFDEWFRDNGPALSNKPYLRQKNELVAMMFLPLLEKMPDWRAIEYLNAGNREPAPSFYEYLARWYQKTPPPQRQLVTNTFGLFNFDPPSEGAAFKGTGTETTSQFLPPARRREEGGSGRVG